MRRAFTYAAAWSVGFWTGVAIEHAYRYTLHAPARRPLIERLNP